ncbi:MAG: hypothetical protein R3E79_15240 [Caldilineaceae bacterium]
MTYASLSNQFARRGWSLWFGLFGGLTAWILHLAVGFAFVHDACRVGLNGIRLWSGIFTLVLAAVALLAVVAAYGHWRRRHHQETNELETVLGARRFMAISGMWFSGLSLLMILLTGIPILWLYPCA